MPTEVDSMRIHSAELVVHVLGSSRTRKYTRRLSAAQLGPALTPQPLVPGHYLHILQASNSNLLPRLSTEKMFSKRSLKKELLGASPEPYLLFFGVIE
jgi:hypothetical protein